MAKKESIHVFDDEELVPAKIPRGCLKMLKTLSGVYGGTIADWTAKLLKPALIEHMKKMAQELEERYLAAEAKTEEESDQD